MPAAFDIVTVTNKMIAELKCPANTVASLAGITGAKLSQYLNGVLRIGAQDEIKLRNTVSQLKKLVEYSRPLPLNYKLAGVLRECIQMIEDGELQIIVYENKQQI
jgi:predicted transcriptional regulator